MVRYAAHIVWADCAAVVSRQELIAILQYLKPRGLPPFGAVVQLAAARHGEEDRDNMGAALQDEKMNFRVPCIMESGGKRVIQWQRVLIFRTPELISSAAARLSRLRAELGDILESPGALPVLARLLFSKVERAEFVPGVITLLADRALTGLELNEPVRQYKYPSVLEDLALLANAFEQLSPGLLRERGWYR